MIKWLCVSASAAKSVLGVAVLLGLCLQIGDIKALLDNRTQGASLYGATDAERATVIGGKLAHYGEGAGVAALWRALLQQRII